ncbi:MAG: GFA family protein [Rhodospirillales bacterium]|jgi:hypothetical protein|nr:GFA family protein [Rhodospirillales bacterium]
MHINGGCHCGNISYQADVDSNNVVICHCTDCQIISGAPYRTTLYTSENDFTLNSGTLKTYIKTAESGNLREQNFCPECGSQIYATSVGDTNRSFGIRVGTINQRDQLIPKTQYFCDSAQSWVQDLSSMKKIGKE